MSELNEEMARVIRTWRVDLGCTWGRIGELAHKVWGFENTQQKGASLCERAALMLNEEPNSEAWN